MSLQEQKLSLIQGLLLVQDKSIINQIDLLIQSALSSNTKSATTDFVDFETWNKQFQDNQNLEDYVEDYGMTLGDFRKQIWQSEMEETVTLEDYQSLLC